MSSSKAEIAAMYRNCDSCGKSMCTEDPKAFEAKGEHYCCKECYDAEQHFWRQFRSDDEAGKP